ncbi:MAG: PP2C family protein-serine/threonine phosphatase [Fusobacterium sp.]|uniref:PP2C family protein-serine/threonine phosphatase n=1 Tax=Fusobacterium sp. TaxID=68766 RepID=UPI00399BE4FE
MNKEIKEHENENTTQINFIGRKYQSVFITSFISERGEKPKNNGYISYIELDNFGCWVVVDGDNGGIFKNKIAPYIGESIIESFIANPTIDKREIEKMLLSIHKKYRNMQSEEINIEQDYSSCSIAMFVTDYAVATFANIGNARYGVLRDHKLVKKSNDDTLAYLQYEAGNILYDEIRFRKDKNIFTKKFGADKSIKINVSDIFVLRPNDRVLLYTQGAWENLDEEDIELISETSERPGKFIGNIVNKMKRNCFLSLGNYTLCGIYVNRPLNIPVPPENNILKLKNQISKNKDSLKKKLLIILALFILIGGGISTYQKIKLNNQINSIKKEISFNLEQGKVRIEEKDYSNAINNYQKIKELYAQLVTYQNNPEDKIGEIDSILMEVQTLIKVQTLSKQGEDKLEEYKFNEAVKIYKEAILTLSNISLDKTIKETLNQQLDVSEKLLEAQEIKIKADELYNYQNKNTKTRKAKQKEAIDLYKNIAPVYKKYNKNIMYDEIMEKINKYEEENKTISAIPKKQEFKKVVKLPTYRGDREFREFRYYDSLKSYENALKGANTTEKKKYLNGKIAMNKQLLIAVELELKGDEYLEKKRNPKKAKKYFEEALNENKKLADNNYMPKDRYDAIITRLENKLKKLK